MKTPAIRHRDFASFAASGVKLRAFNLQSDEARRRYWKSFERVRAGFYGRATRLVYKGLQEQLAFVLDNVRQSRTPSQTVNAVRAATHRMAPIYERRIRQVAREVIPHFAALTLESLPKAGRSPQERKQEPDDVDYWLDVADRYITYNAGTLITAPNETTRAALMAAARIAGQRGLQNGWGMDEIADEIRRESQVHISQHRSTVIARTEVIRASNYASITSAQSIGVPLYKEWIAELDDRVRPSHEAAHGQVVAMDEPFYVGGYSAQYPGDPSLPADETVQCRCTLAYIPVT